MIFSVCSEFVSFTTLQICRLKRGTGTHWMDTLVDPMVIGHFTRGTLVRDLRMAY